MPELTQTEIDDLKNKWFTIGWKAGLREVIIADASPSYESGVEFARDSLKLFAGDE